MRETTDVWFIAWLMNVGHVIKAYHLTSDKKVSCKFEIGDDEWHVQKLAFNNSELQKYKNLIRQIKELRAR